MGESRGGVQHRIARTRNTLNVNFQHLIFPSPALPQRCPLSTFPPQALSLPLRSPSPMPLSHTPQPPPFSQQPYASSPGLSRRMRTFPYLMIQFSSIFDAPAPLDHTLGSVTLHSTEVPPHIFLNKKASPLIGILPFL